MKKKQGFTLIELMVAITVIAILTGLTVVGLSGIRERGADTGRLAGIRDLQLAVEGFRSVNGKYPLAGSGASYIQGLEPGFMAKLPQDKPQSGSAGYVYVVSSDQKSYCVGVRNNVKKVGSHSDLACNANSWVSCRGTEAPTLKTSLGCN